MIGTTTSVCLSHWMYDKRLRLPSVFGWGWLNDNHLSHVWNDFPSENSSNLNYNQPRKIQHWYQSLNKNLWGSVRITVECSSCCSEGSFSKNKEAFEQREKAGNQWTGKIIQMKGCIFLFFFILATNLTWKHNLKVATVSTFHSVTRALFPPKIGSWIKIQTGPPENTCFI